MKIAAFFAALCFALLTSATANARSYHRHHATHYQHVTKASQKQVSQVPGGPSSMPIYEYNADTYAPSKSTPVKVHEQWIGARRGHVHYANRGGSLDAACRSAARQGGPCGCWAQEYFFGSSARLYNGKNLWLAREWARVFPHVTAAAGTAAVWPNGHHVAPVVAVNGDGTVTVHDSWGDHPVRMARLTFVRPSGGRYATAY